MCSILGIFGLQPGDDVIELRREALERSHRQRHRGPDWNGIHVDDGAILVHERLAIVDPEGGSQPLHSTDGALVLAVNGEIYNHRELRRELGDAYKFQTASDCEVINALYRIDDTDSFLNRLSGIFAFALWDRDKGVFLIARDPIGVCPLYWGHDRNGLLWVA
jgi:asparagine synthase (glutamine-hydrolysing)